MFINQRNKEDLENMLLSIMLTNKADIITFHKEDILLKSKGNGKNHKLK